MRCAFVCSDPGVPLFGSKGASIHVRSMIEALRECGTDVTVFARNLSGGLDRTLPGVKVVPLPSLPSSKAGVAARERAAIERNSDLEAALGFHGPFDFIYERYSLFSFAAMELAQKAGLTGILEVNAPLVAEQQRYRSLHNVDAAEEGTRRAFLAASHVSAVSKPLADYCESVIGSSDRIYTTPNAVNPLRFSCSRRASPQGSPFRIGFVSTMKPWHGLAELVEIFSGIRKRTGTAELVMVGDGPERDSFQLQLKMRSLIDNTEFLGAVAPEEVPRWLYTMDVAVAPYPAITPFYFSPLKIVEAMASGLPVIASAQGQICELIHHEVDGFLIEPGDTRGYVAALEVLEGDRGLAFQMGTLARKKILANYTWSALARRVLDWARDGRDG